MSGEYIEVWGPEVLRSQGLEASGTTLDCKEAGRGVGLFGGILASRPHPPLLKRWP
jgi:hypothetical protein